MILSAELPLFVLDKRDFQRGDCSVLYRNVVTGLALRISYMLPCKGYGIFHKSKMAENLREEGQLCLNEKSTHTPSIKSQPSIRYWESLDSRRLPTISPLNSSRYSMVSGLL